MDMLSLTWFFSVYIMKWKDTWLDKSCRELKNAFVCVCVCVWRAKEKRRLTHRGCSDPIGHLLSQQSANNLIA